ncbi:unnamed protein product [Paramecium sonneborni]|uniref:Transmembrane protein n=1 Tax=Paramecium sonneborni TaxID=65129 RepID=A0A8S1NX45_9CILI|nr:unnamed protein product [Paramecium sonneborni]
MIKFRIKVDVNYQITSALKTTKFTAYDLLIQIKIKSIVLYYIFIFILILMALTQKNYMQKYAYALKLQNLSQLRILPFLKLQVNGDLILIKNSVLNHFLISIRQHLLNNLQIQILTVFKQNSHQLMISFIQLFANYQLLRIQHFVRISLMVG